jgi:rhamnogalacturonyl hydrolase YesR
MTDLKPDNLIKLDPEIAKDPLVRGICESLINRSNMGILKYENTMEEMDKPIQALLDDIIEESLDAVVYATKAKIKLKKIIDEYRDRPKK